MAYKAKVTQEVVDLVKHGLVVEGLTAVEVGKRVGVSSAVVGNIKKAGFNLANYRNSYRSEADIVQIVEETPRRSWFSRFTDFLTRSNA